jgi:hypothetical protein
MQIQKAALRMCELYEMWRLRNRRMAAEAFLAIKIRVQFRARFLRNMGTNHVRRL